MEKIEPGVLLVADPFLKDPNFSRTVILMCDHQKEGSFGFVLNRLIDSTLADLIPDTTSLKIPVSYGGPVQQDTLHFLHKRPDLISDGLLLTDEIHWGGNFNTVLELLEKELILLHDIRFFLGYSGWSEGQLDEEIKESSWLTSTSTSELIFETTTDKLWAAVLKHMGGEFEKLVNYPIDPQLN